MEGGGCLYYVEGLFPDEDYPVAVFVRTFAVKDLPATEVGNLLLDSFELDIEFVGEGFPGQRGVIYKGVDDALGGESHDYSGRYAIDLINKGTITINPQMSDDSNVTYTLVKLTSKEMVWQKEGTTYSVGTWGSDYRHFVRVK